MNNIILIGMPGSGKSTVGVILAKILGYDFIDTDLLIQKRQKARLSEIIEKEGSAGFLAVENEVCRTLIADHCVIATGGSVIYGAEAMQNLKSLGKIVYLEVSYKNLEQRLHDIRTRGVVLPKGESLFDLYRERTALYEQYADIIIFEGNSTLEETVQLTAEKCRDIRIH